MEQEWLKKRLKDQGLRLLDAAEVLGIPAPRITDVIKGNRRVQADELKRLSTLLEMDIEQLLLSLEKGSFTEAKNVETTQTLLPISGVLYGDGTIRPLSSDEGAQTIPMPLEIENPAAVHCFRIGDSTYDHWLKKDTLIIAANPRVHKITPKSDTLMLLGSLGESITIKPYFQADQSKIFASIIWSLFHY